MIVKANLRGEIAIIELIGELDHHSADKVKKEIDKALADEKIKELILDLKGLKFMDSSGIGVLLGRYKALVKRNGRMSAMNVNDQVDRIFDIAGLYKIIRKIS